jgi:hypothetical protein
VRTSGTIGTPAIAAMPAQAGMQATAVTPVTSNSKHDGKAKQQKYKQQKHKVLIYIEHHSVCPLVGIGTPPPL